MSIIFFFFPLIRFDIYHFVELELSPTFKRRYRDGPSRTGKVSEKRKCNKTFSKCFCFPLLLLLGGRDFLFSSSFPYLSLYFQTFYADFFFWFAYFFCHPSPIALLLTVEEIMLNYSLTSCTLMLVNAFNCLLI